MAFGGGGSDLRHDGKYKSCGGDQHKSHRDFVNYQFRGRDFSNTVLKITLICVVIGLSCILLNQFDYRSGQLVQSSHSFGSAADSNQRIVSVSSSSSILDEFKYEDLTSHKNDDNSNLEKALKMAAMKDEKTVIITTLNAAWTEPNSLFDLFLESFKIGIETQSLLKHLVVVALDKKAYSRCLEVHSHCYALTTTDVDFSGPAAFMSGDYLKMLWRRIDFLRTVLEMGYNFVFTDADVMWLRNPFQRFFEDADFQIACDFYRHNSTNFKNYPNGGFNYVKSNIRTIQLYKFWFNGQYYFPKIHDQDVFNKIKLNPFITEIGLKIRFLDTAYFGGFCQPSKDLDVVVTMHANCCVGMKTKIHDIKMVLHDWKEYTRPALSAGNIIEKPSRKRKRKRTWTVPRICGFKNNNKKKVNGPGLR